MSGGLRGLPLRSRLALLVALAVAVAVAAVSVACWFFVRAVLVSSLDESLTGNRVPPQDVRGLIDENGQCGRGVPVNPTADLFTQTVQVVDQEGNSCVIFGRQALQVTSTDTAVAAGSSDASPSDAGGDGDTGGHSGDGQDGVLHDATAENGASYRAYTYPLEGVPGVAVTVARPLGEVENTLDDLLLVLLPVAGVGVAVAGAVGLWVARAGLRPVDELTGAVEHIARTEDLTVRIPVEGDDEIARLSRSFNAMTTALASSRDLQQQLIADAGHELRTPLTSLRTNIDLLVRSEESGRAIPADDRRALLASVRAQMTELASLIGDLQELSRPEAAVGSRTEVVALHELAGTALRRARLRGPELTFRTSLEPWYVRAEAPALERALVNVLDNAVKFSPPSGVVEVALSEGVLTVRDEGPGIPAEELPYVFDRFWRSPEARGLPGSGLGLSIVARTVRQAGGEVSLGPAEMSLGPAEVPLGPASEERPAVGTVALIRLPGAPTPPPGEAEAYARDNPEEPQAGQ